MNKEEKLKIAEWLGLKNDKLCHWTTCKCIENNIELRREKIKLNKEIKYKDEIIKGLGTNVLPISIEGFEVLLNKTKEENKRLQKELDKKDKLIELIYNLFYEYISIRPMSGIKFLNDKGFSKCKNCEKELEDENGISCKECIKEQFIKKAREENE